MLEDLPVTVRSRTSSWAARLGTALLVGAAVGLPTLGVGGRLAMFGYAQLTARVSHWTVGGTLTVIMSGGIAGAVAALLFVVVERWLLPRTGPFVRGLAFGALTLGVASPGIRPPWPRTFALFAPAFLAFGLVFVHIHGRWSGGRRSWLSFIPVQGASSRLIQRWICRSAR